MISPLERWDPLCGLYGACGVPGDYCFSHLSSFFALFSYLLRLFYAFPVNARCGCLRFCATFWPYSPTLSGFDLIPFPPCSHPHPHPPRHTHTHTHKKHSQYLMSPAVIAVLVACSTQKIVVYILQQNGVS